MKIAVIANCTSKVLPRIARVQLAQPFIPQLSRFFMDSSKRRRDVRHGRNGPPRARRNVNNYSSASQAGRPQPQRASAAAAAETEMEGVEPTPVERPSPPKADRRFSELADSNLVHPTVVQTITEDLKFDYMTPVQAATLNELLPPSRNDCLVQAKTGTGKTMAFLLPALQTMITQGRGGKKDGSSLLVISPTRELAQQIANEANNLLKRLPKYRVCVAIGGTNKDREEKQILAGCDILIATPGRLLDHMSNEEIRYSFRQLDTLVLDEADRLLDMGFKKNLQDIVKNLPSKTETRRQGMLFSATIAPHVQQVASLVLGPDYKFISTIPAGEVNTHERVPQLLIEVPTFSDVAAATVSCLREEKTHHDAFKAIVFAPTAALADLYGFILVKCAGMPPVSVLHSRISQGRRTKITNEYRTAKSAVLVATDVVARGMDFPGVTSVVQVGIPSDKESYIHRLGRTARADADGRGIFIVTKAEAFFPKWTLKEITFVPHNADLSTAPDVKAIVEKMEDLDRAKIYQAWLGYYKNHVKALKWDLTELVAQGNRFARDGLAAPETPALFKSTVGKMGLRGTKGLTVVPDPPRQGGGRGGGGGGRGGNRGSGIRI